MKPHINILLLFISNLHTYLCSDTFSSLIQDPRKNSSLYDLALKENVSYGSMIGNLSEILIHKNQIDKSSRIKNYKLIYYSPQLIPSSLFSSTRTLNQTSIFTEPIFSVDNQTGAIFIKTPNEPILEYLCIKKAYCSCLSCIFSLNIIFSTENKINAETVRLFIDDNNDYIPEFYSSDSSFLISVSESSKIGDYFKLSNAAAFDSDAFYNDILYYISDRDIFNSQDKSELRSNLFEVIPVSPESKDLNLILKSHLDYETQKQYELYLIAKDNGNPYSLKVSKKLIVNVIDENDNSPICEKSLFIENLNENKIERDFLQIRASDLDSGYNGRLQYKILDDPKNLTKHENLFEIDKLTGWLSLKQPLDYEKKQFYDLKIQVNDSGLKNTFTTFCNARININDLNDNPAQMKIIKYLNESVQRGYYVVNTMSDSHDSNDDYDLDYDLELNYTNINSKNQIEFYENNQNEIVLALIRVFDRDSLNNYKFSIQSVSKNGHEDTSMFEIRMSDKSNREYELIGLDSFNSEYLPNYRLKITLYDLQNFDRLENDPQLMINKLPEHLVNDQNFFETNLYEKVKILDLNDNKPEFLKKIYRFKIKENLFNESLISLNPIEIYDLDSSDMNSKVKFKIIDKANSSFKASDFIYVNDSNNNYPNLMVIKPFDYETHGDEVEFELMASDIDNQSDICTIVIKIDDVNDNRPIFFNNNTTFTLKENLKSNNFIGQVIAIDKDSIGPYSDLTYILKNDNYKNYFRIHKTGVISSLISFDREKENFFTLKVEAFDKGVPSLSSIGTFYVQIEDENDNRPIITYPKPSSKYMNIKLVNLNQNSNLIKVFDTKAFDDDYDANGLLKYFIKDSLNLLKIDEFNGSVYFNLSEFNIKDVSQLNEFKKMLDVYLRVQDCGKPILSSAINFTLYLNYDLSELPTYVQKSIIGDLKNNDNNNKHEMINSHLYKFGSDRNVFQIVSNSVLLIILFSILLFMILVACFLIVVMYKRIIQKKSKNQSNNVIKSKNDNNSETNTFLKFLNNPKVHFKTCFKFKNSKIIKKVKQEDKLTVKDELNNEKITTISANTFKITIKNFDSNSNKCQVFSDGFRSDLNDLSMIAENEEKYKNESIDGSNGTNVSEDMSDEINVYSTEITVNDFFRNTLTKKNEIENKLVVTDEKNSSSHKFSTSSNSDNNAMSLNTFLDNSSSSIKKNIREEDDDENDFYQHDYIRAENYDIFNRQNYFKQSFKCKITPFNNLNRGEEFRNYFPSNKIKNVNLIGSQTTVSLNNNSSNPDSSLSEFIEKFEKFYNTNTVGFSENNPQSNSNQNSNND